jgi:hypothetical protein
LIDSLVGAGSDDLILGELGRPSPLLSLLRTAIVRWLDAEEVVDDILTSLREGRVG